MNHLINYCSLYCFDIFYIPIKKYIKNTDDNLKVKLKLKVKMIFTICEFGIIKNNDWRNVKLAIILYFFSIRDTNL